MQNAKTEVISQLCNKNIQLFELLTFTFWKVVIHQTKHASIPLEEKQKGKKILPLNGFI